MATNYSQPGNVIELTAPVGGVVSGTAYLIGGLLVVALHDADAGQKFSGAAEGVFRLPKEGTTAAFSEGDVVYWDNTAMEFDESAVGRFPAATAVSAAIATDAYVYAKLVGQAVTAVV